MRAATVVCPSGEGGRKGFALLAALWIVVVTSGVALRASVWSGTHRTLALRGLESRQAHAAAEAGVAWARSRLDRRLAEPATVLGSSSLDPWAGASTIDELPVPPLTRGGFHVRIRDLGAILNLNRASEAEIERLLLALEVDAGRADRLAQAIADWKDVDDARRARGAEAADYMEVEALPPRNGEFASVEELGWVRGMDRELLARLRPHLSVVGSGEINLHSAPRPVLLTLPGFGPEAASALLLLRERGVRLGSVADLGTHLSAQVRDHFFDALPELLPRVTLTTDEVEVVSTGWHGDDGDRVTLHARLVRTSRSAHLAGVDPR